MAARQHLTNVLLLGALSATALYLVFTREAPTTQEISARESSAVRVFRRDALTELIFEREGQTFRLMRGVGGDAGGEPRPWVLRWSDRSEQADAFAVDRALNSLDHAAQERTIKPEEVNRGQFGLEKPRLRVTLVAGGLRTTLAVGGAAPRPEGAVYLDDNGAVRVVKASALEALDTAPEGFLSRNIAPYISSELRQMKIQHGGGEVTLERLVGLSWKLASGELAGARADRFLLERLVTSFPDLKADHFLPEAEAQKIHQENRPVLVTMVPSDEGKPRGLFAVGGPCPGHPDEVVVLRTEPTQLAACSGKGALDVLQRTAEQFADTRVFSLRDDEIEEVAMEQGDRKIDLARKGKDWKQRAPVEADVAADQARALVKALGTTRGDQLRREVPDGFSATAKVTIRGPRENEDARPAETVELGKPGEEGFVWLRRQQDGTFVRLNRDQARPFFPRTTALRSTRLIEHAIDQAREIRVWQGGEPLQQLRRRADGSWSLEQPKGYGVDVGVVADLAENLLHLSAEQWVADADDGSFGLARPRFRAEVVVNEGDGGARTYDLTLGEVAPGGGTYGRLAGSEGVFLVPRALETTLSSLAIDLAVFMLDLDALDELTFRLADRVVTLPVKNGQLLPPRGVDLPPSRLEKLKAALLDLRAQRVVHLGGARKEEGLEKPSLEISPRGAGKPRKIVIGASDVAQNTSIYYARAEGVDATYAIPAARVRAMLDAL
jgi:hypothetical protein